MSAILRRVSLLCLLTLVGGCSTTSSSKPADALVSESRDVFGSIKPAVLVFVPSGGAAADRVFIAASRRSGPSALARDLAGIVARAETDDVKMSVSGDSPAKTQQVILDALKLNEGRTLTHLQLLLVGPPAYREPVRKAVERVGGTFLFREAR